MQGCRLKCAALVNILSSQLRCLDQNLMDYSRITDHILHLYGVVILVAHVVVDFVRVIWDVSDLFDV